MVKRDTAWSDWYALFGERDGGCDAGRAWVDTLPEGLTCEEVLERASEDRSFRIGWAAWAITAFCGELDARLRGQLFALVRRKPMVAAVLFRDYGDRLGTVDRKRCLMAFHSGFRTDGRRVLPTVEGEIGVLDG
ncbi:hypothetical protein [Chlorobium limicola]